MFITNRRMVALEAEIGRLKRELDSESEHPEAGARTAAPTMSAPLPGERRSRRALFKTAAAAGVAVAAAPLLAGKAGAADNAPVVIGVENSSSITTRLNADIGTGALGNVVFAAADGGSGSFYDAAIGGFAFNNRVSNGIYAYANGRTDGDPITGHAAIALATPSARSHLWMVPQGGDPRADATVAHTVGEFRADASSQLWYCVQSGTPGVWRKIASPTTAGAVHAIQPTRVWDSRLAFGGGIMTNLQNRVISVADGRDLVSGAVTQVDVVPTGATAVMFNLAVVSASAVGYLSVTPGDADNFSAASINWSSANQVLNNGTMSTLSATRQLKVWCSGSTHFIVDITGYML